MRLTDNGVVRLQELYFELGSLLEGHLTQFDKLIMGEEGNDPQALEQMIEVLKNTVDEFEEESTRIYTEEWTSPEDY